MKLKKEKEPALQLNCHCTDHKIRRGTPMNNNKILLVDDNKGQRVTLESILIGQLHFQKIRILLNLDVILTSQLCFLKTCIVLNLDRLSLNQ